MRIKGRVSSQYKKKHLENFHQKIRASKPLLTASCPNQTFYYATLSLEKKFVLKFLIFKKK